MSRESIKGGSGVSENKAVNQGNKMLFYHYFTVFTFQKQK